MNRRTLFTAPLAAALAIAAAAAIPARAAVVHPPLNAFFTKTRMVKLTLRNDSAAPLKLKAGDQTMTLEPGKPAALKLAEGTSITVDEATPQHAAGSLIAHVSTALEGTTVVIH